MSKRVTVDEVSAFLVHEAALLDDRKFVEWRQLFSESGTYRIPIGRDDDPQHHLSLVYDDPARLDERVYHLTEVPFPAQSPYSRTIHFITNVRLDDTAGPENLAVESNQLVAELRLGDFRQVGLGEQRFFVAAVSHTLTRVDNARGFEITGKTVDLLTSQTPLSNLTFLL